MERPGRNKKQGQPPPGLDYPGTSRGRTPRTGSSGAEQAAGAAPRRTRSSGEKGRPDAPDWKIRGGSGSRSQRTQDRIDNGHVAGRRPGLEHPGQNKKERPQLPRPGKDGLPPRAGLPVADQPERDPTPRAGACRGGRRPEEKETGGRDQGGAAKETSPEATQRTTPGKCREAEKWTRLRRRRAAKMRTGPW